jgi:hypothetical protein
MLAFDAMVVVTLLEVWRERKSGVGSMGIEFLSPIVLLLALSIIFPSLQSIFQQQIFSIISVKPINDMPILLDPLVSQHAESCLLTFICCSSKTAIVS